MDHLALHHLEETELQPELPLDFDRQVPEDEESTIAIINIFQSVQRRHQSTGKGLMWRDQCGFVKDRTVQIAAHEIIRALEVVLSWVHFISDFELNDRRWIHWFSVFLFNTGYPSSFRALTYNQVIILAAQPSDS